MTTVEYLTQARDGLRKAGIAEEAINLFDDMLRNRAEKAVGRFMQNPERMVYVAISGDVQRAVKETAKAREAHESAANRFSSGFLKLQGALKSGKVPPDQVDGLAVLAQEAEKAKATLQQANNAEIKARARRKEAYVVWQKKEGNVRKKDSDS